MYFFCIVYLQPPANLHAVKAFILQQKRPNNVFFPDEMFAY